MSNIPNDSSIIPEEIDKFSKLAEQWWDKSGKFKVLHDFNKPRLDFIISCLEKQLQQKVDPTLLKSKTALDIGCGGGILSESLYNLGLNVTGLDASYPSITSARIHSKSVGSNISYIYSTIEDYITKTPGTTFDYIFAMEIIEHVNNPESFLRDTLSVLNKNGIMFLSTINKNVKSLLTAKFAAEYILRWLPAGTHEFNKFITPQNLDNILKVNNAKISEIKGINYNLFLKTWNIVQKPSVNYIVCIEKT